MSEDNPINGLQSFLRDAIFIGLPQAFPLKYSNFSGAMGIGAPR
jgi:hypothetical protein